MIEKKQFLESIFNQSSATIPILEFGINLLLTFLLANIIAYAYIYYGHSLSNRKAFSNNLALLSMTTMLIITIVKSSLALSLGLVGALSIVRFRTALKEPEELTFAFLAIAVGLGLGANQAKITILGVLLMLVFFIFKNKWARPSKSQYLNLIISSKEPSKIDYNIIIQTLCKNCDLVNIKRLSEDASYLESAINVEVKDFKQLMTIKTILKKEYPSLSVNFVDNTGLINT